MSTVAELLKKNKDQLKNRAKESQERKEEKPWSYGTIFLKDKFPEGLKEWIPEKGEHEIDILSFVSGSQHPRNAKDVVVFSVDLWVFQYVGPNNDQFVTPGVNFKKRDPIAEYISQSRGELSKARYNQVRPKRRVIYLVWVHDTPEEEEKGIQIWNVSHYFMGEPLDEAAKLPRSGGHILFAHPSKDIGKRIFFEIKKTGKFEDAEGKEREGIEFTAPKFLDRKEELPEHIAEPGFSLDELIDMHPSYDRIYESFFQRKVGEAIPDMPNTPDTPNMSEERTKTAPKIPYGECPHGHKFGVDLSQMNECKKCVVWDDCQAKNSESNNESEKETKMTILKDSPEPEQEEQKDQEEQGPKETARKGRRGSSSRTSRRSAA